LHLDLCERVVRSFGLCLFNLLGSSSSFSNMVASSFVMCCYFGFVFPADVCNFFP
jgi:hypothetical protein